MEAYLIETFSYDGATAVNSNSSRTPLANSISIYSIKGNSVFSNGPKSLPKNSPDCPILCNWVFDNFILAEELLAKALRSLKTCKLVNKNLWGKLFSLLELPTTNFQS